jgi:hypothetical protein
MSGVTIYEDANFQGKSANLDVGEYDWGQLGIANDTLSSLIASDGIEVRLFENTHFSGRSVTFEGSVPYVGDDFNDITSSIIVLQILPP